MGGFELAERGFLVAGAASAFLAVAAGAFGAHGLKGTIPAERLEAFEVGVRYHLFHSLGLFAAAWVSSRSPSKAARMAGWLLGAGIVLFSGSLYALSLTGAKGLGAVTPFGGLAFLAGWALLALAATRIGAPPVSSGR